MIVYDAIISTCSLDTNYFSNSVVYVTVYSYTIANGLDVQYACTQSKYHKVVKTKRKR